MISMTQEQQDRIGELERMLRTRVDGEAHFVLWSLPLLEALAFHVVALMARVKDLEGRMGNE
jgi:hypothetical protein